MLGRAALLLFFDIAPEAIAEHDDWHTHEHLPERLSIPGFVRGTRWVALRAGQPRYFVIYEVADVGVLTSGAYLERLNNPTPWTQKVMPQYRGMTRGFCAMTARGGLGLGNTALVARFKPAGDPSWLRELLPGLASRPGLGGCYLFESAASAPMTREQSIRGKDAGVDWVLVATGYDAEAVARLEQAELQKLEGARFGLYRTDYALYEAEAKRAHDPLRPRRAGFLAVARTIFFGLLMIGKKQTWETNGIGAQMTPGQIVAGALVGGVVLVGLLILIVRIVIGLAAG